MEKQEAQLEWTEAQKIIISMDLIAAAKKQLQFLETVDRNRYLYDGPALHRAIFRYKHCWLPLLSMHSESKFPEGQLVVPLDCEWIWHCHRLNPVRYKTDCQQLFGRILGACNVVSSTHGACTKQTEEIWRMMYPEEPFELDIASENKIQAAPSTNYDLVSAVQRQTPFYFQVSRSYMKDSLFLEGAEERYKGFLHLIRRNMEMKWKRSSVPTYDIDLIWHSHQLHPVSYYKDVTAILGKLLEHDDTDSNRDKGGKLDIGSLETTKQWKETFGSSYWRAGSMYRGPAPTPIPFTPHLSTIVSKKLSPISEYQNMIQLPTSMLVEVFLEVVGVRNLPPVNSSSLFLAVSKKKPDLFFKTKRRLSISFEAGVKPVAAFQCESTGDLVFELTSYLPSDLQPTQLLLDTLGTTSISLPDLVNSASKLSVVKLLEFAAADGTVSSGPITLSIAVSVTPPVPGPYALRMIKEYQLSRNPSFFPLPAEMIETVKKWRVIVDGTGNEVISLLMRDQKKLESGDKSTSRKEVLGMAKSGETCVLAEFNGENWLLMGSQWFLQLQKNGVNDKYIFELVGSKKLLIFQGRKLGYEIKNRNEMGNEMDFMTVVEFLGETPYGKAVALMNLRSGIVEVEEELLVLPISTLAFVLADHILKRDAKDVFTKIGEKDSYRYSDQCGGEYGSDEENAKGLYSCGQFEGGACGAECSSMCKATCSSGCVSPCSSPCTHPS